MEPKLTSTLVLMDKLIPKNKHGDIGSIPLDSPMVTFYRNKSVFLTGGTGFLGQLFVEKLLRCGVKEIYVLARPKKGKLSKDRLAEVYSGPVYEKLSKIDPTYMERVKPIEGNMMEPAIGISEKDRKDIIENVQIVLHSAAEVRFDETLQHLLLVNLRGTRDVLQLAEQIKQLEVFIHISTAYSYCPLKQIEERFYIPPIDPHYMIRMAEQLQDTNNQRDFEILTERIIRPWPNTYTYTKALAEELVRQFGERFPVALIRPSIVVATHEDPIPGWINNIYGLTGVLVSTGLGFQRILPYKRNLIGDIVCADFVVNSTLAAAWSTKEDQKQIYQNTENNEVHRNSTKVYHIASYRDSPVTYGEVADRIQEIFYEIPSEKILWLPMVNVTDFIVLEFIYTILYHIIPAIFFDGIFKIWGSKLRLMPMYRKVQKFMKANTYFMTREWIFDNDVMKTVYDKMSADDKRFFPGDLRNYNFRDFSKVYYLGMRAYIMNEVEFDKSKAFKKVRYLQIAHAFVLFFYYSGLALLIYGLSHQFGFNNEIYKIYEMISIYATSK